MPAEFRLNCGTARARIGGNRGTGNESISICNIDASTVILRLVPPHAGISQSQLTTRVDASADWPRGFYILRGRHARSDVGANHAVRQSQTSGVPDAPTRVGKGSSVGNGQIRDDNI